MKPALPDAAVDRWGRLDNPGARAKAQYVGFRVGAEKFGVPLLRLAEVRTLHDLTPVMLPPEYRTGRAVIHGHFVSLVDLRVELGCTAGFGRDTRVVFAWRQISRCSASLLGLIVDDVEVVGAIAESELAPAAEDGDLHVRRSIIGVVSEDEGRRVIVDLDYWVAP